MTIRVTSPHDSPVEVSVSYPAAEGAIPAPGPVRSDAHLAAVVSLRVVNIPGHHRHYHEDTNSNTLHLQLQRSALMRLNQTEQILALVQHTVRPCNNNGVTNFMKDPVC